MAVEARRSGAVAEADRQGGRGPAGSGSMSKAPSADAISARLSSASLVDLVNAATGGDESAFAALHHRVGAGLRRVLLRRTGGRAELVEDLLQTTWGAVWKALKEGRYDPSRAAITTFVYAVGNNAFLTHLRKTSRERGLLERGDARRGSEAGTGVPEDVLAAAEAADLVRLCLRDGSVAGLTEHERLVLREIGAGESDRGLARRLGISCSTVNVRKHAGLAKIRVYLERAGIVETEPAAGPMGDMP